MSSPIPEYSAQTLEEIHAVAESVTDEIPMNTLLRDALQEAEERIISLTRTIEEKENLHKKDIETIAHHLIKAAREYEWCSVYDNKYEELNEELTVKLPSRQKQFLITGKVLVDLRVYARLDFDAGNEEAKAYLYDAEYRDILDASEFYTREFQDVEIRPIS